MDSQKTLLLMKAAFASMFAYPGFCDPLIIAYQTLQILPVSLLAKATPVSPLGPRLS